LVCSAGEEVPKGEEEVEEEEKEEEEEESFLIAKEEWMCWVCEDVRSARTCAEAGCTHTHTHSLTHSRMYPRTHTLRHTPAHEYST